MPPKVKITKEDIIQTAVHIVRTQGGSALNARNIAAKLGCSTQPIFSNFSTMEQLQLAVVDAADQLCQQYIKREMDCGKFPPYKASGMAYIRFAKEECALFKLLYMRDRTYENIPSESEQGNQLTEMVQSSTAITEEEAKLFHLEMWAFVHGIATMTATGYLNLDWDLISKMLTDAYQGLKKHYERRA